MKSININQTWSKLIIYLFELALGIVLLIDPIKFTNGIIIITGAILVIAGIISIIRYFRQEVNLAIAEFSLSKGLICVALGLFCALRSDWFIATLPVITVFYGVVILLIGIMKIQYTVDLLRLRVKGWTLTGISAVLTLVFAAVILINPFSTVTVLWRFTAIILIAEAVLDIVSLIFARRPITAGWEEAE